MNEELNTAVLEPTTAIAPISRAVDGEIVTTTAQMSYTKEDLVDIAVVKAETEIADRLRESKAARDKAVEKRDKARGKYDAVVGAMTAGLEDDAPDVVRGALETIYPNKKHRPTMSVSYSLVREDSCNLFSKKLPRTAQYKVSIVIGNSYSGLPPIIRPLDISQVVKDAHAAWQAAEEDLDLAQKEYETWQTAGANLPQFRRQVKAKLAAAQLAKTVGGKKVLGVLLEKMDAEIVSFAKAAANRRELQMLASDGQPRRRRR